MPIPDVIRFMADIPRGLEYLHELNLYHNDIKPKNILIGGANQGVLTDYGITCHSPSGQPVQPRSAYKLHIAPEVLNSNQINVQTDIYQVGLTALRLLNGIGHIRDKFNISENFIKSIPGGCLRFATLDVANRKQVQNATSDVAFWMICQKLSKPKRYVGFLQTSDGLTIGL